MINRRKVFPKKTDELIMLLVKHGELYAVWNILRKCVPLLDGAIKYVHQLDRKHFTVGASRTRVKNTNEFIERFLDLFSYEAVLSEYHASTNFIRYALSLVVPNASLIVDLHQESIKNKKPSLINYMTKLKYKLLLSELTDFVE
jgi:hypothetical protein